MKEYTSEEYIQYRLQRAKDTINEIQDHIDNEYWNTAINRMYYACFYAVSALLVNENIHVSSHSGIRQKFGEYFVKPGKIDRNLAKHFTDISEKRHKGDYNDFFDYDRETVLGLYPKSKALIQEIEKILQE